MINKVIVLGGAGFLGSHIIRSLKKKSEIHVTYGDIKENRSLKCKFIYFNILDKEGAHSFLSNYDTVINCTGQISKPINLCFMINSKGLLGLSSNKHLKDTRFIHISTVSVYGSAKLCDENSNLNPETAYAMSKAFSEKILSKNFKSNKLVILRLPNLYGYKQKKGIFSYLLKSYRTNQKLDFNNNGSLYRSYIHAEDCSEIICSIVQNSKIEGTFNIVGNEEITVKSLIKNIEQEFNIVFKKTFKIDNPWENIEKLDGSRLKSLIKYDYKWNIIKFFKRELSKN